MGLGLESPYLLNKKSIQEHLQDLEKPLLGCSGTIRVASRHSVAGILGVWGLLFLRLNFSLTSICVKSTSLQVSHIHEELSPCSFLYAFVQTDTSIRR